MNLIISSPIPTQCSTAVRSAELCASQFVSTKGTNKRFANHFNSWPSECRLVAATEVKSVGARVLVPIGHFVHFVTLRILIQLILNKSNHKHTFCTINNQTHKQTIKLNLKSTNNTHKKNPPLNTKSKREKEFATGESKNIAFVVF